jgi:rubrerythrin
MATKENLQEAFAGESQANRRYVAFAVKAEQDGFPNVAKVFRAAAEAETVHALAHLRVMKGVKSTVDALQSVQESRDIGDRTIFVCSVCGNTVLNEPPDTCPICGSLKKKFYEVK